MKGVHFLSWVFYIESDVFKIAVPSGITVKLKPPLGNVRQ